MTGCYPAPRVEIAPDAEENGLAAMIAGLIQQNLEDQPHKRADFARLMGRVCLIADDAGVCLTLVFDPGRLTLHDGVVGVPRIVVRASSDDIVQLSLVELTPRWGLPDPKGEVAGKVLQAMREGRIHVSGALWNLRMALRLTRVMSVG